MFSLFQRWLLFPRYLRGSSPDAGDRVPGLEKIWIDSGEGRIEAWYLPGKGRSAAAPGPAVIFAHGNAELIDDWPEVLSGYRRMGVGVLLPEYRGYGRSAGSPSEAALSEDFARFYGLLIKRPEVDRERIVFHGRSLGGGVVCALAAVHPPRALVLNSTFTSVAEMARKFFVPSFMVSDPFDNQSVVSTLDCPVLILHGRYDEVIPFWHAEQLLRSARRGELIAYDCDHFCPADWGPVWRDLERFLRRHKVL